MLTIQKLHRSETLCLLHRCSIMQKLIAQTRKCSIIKKSRDVNEILIKDDVLLKVA